MLFRLVESGFLFARIVAPVLLFVYYASVNDVNKSSFAARYWLVFAIAATLGLAFVMCSSQKTLPAAILIWKSHFLSLPLGPLIMVVYHLIQLVVDSVLAPGFMKLPLIRLNKPTLK